MTLTIGDLIRFVTENNLPMDTPIDLETADGDCFGEHCEPTPRVTHYNTTKRKQVVLSLRAKGTTDEIVEWLGSVQ